MVERAIYLLVLLVIFLVVVFVVLKLASAL